MLRITEAVYDAVIEHARRDAPKEACGFLGGEPGSASVHFPMRNTDDSAVHFALDPSEQFAVLKEAIKLGIKLTVCYHSHPETPARPSEEDLKKLTDPKLSYIIVSLADGKVDVKSFKIRGGIASAEEIEVIR
jgi:proteasome lid subunit RPN8/RPN11